MVTDYVLIDFENVQPKDLARFKDGAFKVFVFVGPSQTRIPIETAAAIQSLGARAEYVKVEKAGRNALDLVIAYSIGVLSAQHPTARFHIISKDNGFGTLVHQLAAKKVKVACHTQVSHVLSPKHEPECSVEAVVADLIKRKTSKPRTVKTLRSTIHTLFKREISSGTLEALLKAMVEKHYLKIDGNKVTYTLPVEI